MGLPGLLGGDRGETMGLIDRPAGGLLGGGGCREETMGLTG